MNRRIALVISIVGLNLMACCCGGIPKQPKADPKVAAQNPEPPAVQNPPAEVAPVVKPAEKPLVFPPEPVFTLRKSQLPIRKFNMVLASTESSITDKIKVELISGNTELNEPVDRHLVVKIRIYNEGRVSVDYKPWAMVTELARIPDAQDEHGKRFSPRQPSPRNTTPLTKATKIDSGNFVDDFIAFSVPPPTSQEVDFKLPGRNVTLPSHWFAFKIGRAFFGKEEDDHLAKLDKDQQIGEFKAKHAEWAKSVAVIKQKALDEAKARAKAEAEAEQKRIAKLESDRLAAIAAAEAAKQKAIQDQLPKVTRVNYNRIVIGMSYAEVRAILGNGKENARSNGFAILTWRSDDVFSATVISITFENGSVASKAIIGD